MSDKEWWDHMRQFYTRTGFWWVIDYYKSHKDLPGFLMTKRASYVSSLYD
jgi:hypothetical protein